MKFFWTCLLALTGLCLFPIRVLATQYQQCLNTTNCTVGEFLYDDQYQPISVGSTCTLTSRYPNGDVLLNAVALDSAADGWHSYSVGTSGLSAGTYRGQMCCDTNGEHICLDKTFEISSGLSSSLVADIWSYPSRSLNSFGSLVSGIWSNPNRTLTSNSLDNGTSLATTNQVANLSVQVSAVQTSVGTIDTKVTSLQTQVGDLQTKTDNILAKWGSSSVTDIINYVDSLETQLGNNSQTCADNSVFGHVQCLVDKWGTESASTLLTAANSTNSSIASVRSELNFNGKSTTAYDEIMAIKSYVDTLESSVGASSDTSSTASIFGRIKQDKETIDSIDNTTLDLTDLMNKWGSYSATDIYDKVKDLSTQVAAINTVSNVENITNNNISQTTDLTEIKNQVMAMRALLDVNRIQLEKLDNKPIIKSWLENGSIIFKSLITNPSSSISQDVPFVYYLPPEVKQSDIIKKSENLTVTYDTSKSLLSATGDFKLKPKQTLVVEIEVQDIWSVPQAKIDSLRRQADDLFLPLKKTSYFAQGSTLHADIQASLDRIEAIQKPAKLPEDKIKDYREAQIELDSANKKMDSLKEIVTSAGSIGTLSGFIGGVQTMSVWGIVVILVAGFIFLAIYIRSIISKNDSPESGEQKIHFHRPERNVGHHFQGFVLVLLFGLSFGASSTLVYYLKVKPNTSPSPQVLSATATPTIVPTQAPTPTTEIDQTIVSDTPTLIEDIPAPTETPSPTIAPSPKPTVTVPIVSATTLKKVVITPSINSYVNLRSEPDRNSILVTKVLSGQDLSVVDQKYNDRGELWLKTTYNDSSGWILAELTQAIKNSPTEDPAKVKIVVPSHDTVYLYSRPSFNSPITSKLTVNQLADILVETKRWTKVILAKTSLEGWVSQDFIEKVDP